MTFDLPRLAPVEPGRPGFVRALGVFEVAAFLGDADRGGVLRGDDADRFAAEVRIAPGECRAHCFRRIAFAVAPGREHPAGLRRIAVAGLDLALEDAEAHLAGKT